MSGLSRYESQYLKQDPFLGPLSLVSFCLLVFLCEIAHRVSRKKNKMQIDTPHVDEQSRGCVKNGIKIYSADAVEREVAAGEPLVVFDNLVLNLGKSRVPYVNYV